jgi:hypothetical protein
MEQAFAGQSNGLCGAAVDGALFLVTGTDSGFVRFTVEWHETEPLPAGGEWEEAVEASFTPRHDGVRLLEWDGSTTHALDLGRVAGVGHGVRYCASGLARRREDVGGDYADVAEDRYLLVFWPEPEGRPDAVLRQTSDRAAGRHRWAHGLPVSRPVS